MPNTMTTEELRHMAVIIISMKIRATLENPNSEKSKEISSILEKKTGIPDGEIHRFHNAVLNENLHNSFKEERAGEIAWALCKTFLQHEYPSMRLRGHLGTFANEQQVSLNHVLETFRTLFHEIIDENLSAQSKP
jgi:hypothetical protein